MNPPTLPEYIKPGAVVCVKNNEHLKFRIYATDCGNTHCVHGAFFVSEAWRIAAIDPERIIGPWIDKPDCSALWPLLPPWIKYLAMDKNYGWFGYKNKPLQGISSWHSNGTEDDYCTIPSKYVPIYSGDWKDSLVERPQ